MIVASQTNVAITAGLDFILGHLEEPKFPRTVSTHTTEGRQIFVYNKEKALAICEQANFLDCRISAYPEYTQWSGINRQAPNLIFIDEDRSNFKSRESLDRTHKRTLKTIQEKLNGAHPTVLWSGNGYHTLQPIEAFVLESEEVFTPFENPSIKFLRFAEPYLSGSSADPCHSNSLSFRNCMLRIPGSHNSKCVFANNGTADTTTEVRIIQKWDGNRPAINWILRDFRRYLIQDRINKNKQRRRSNYYHAKNSTNNNSIYWIDLLLKSPISDYRKYAISLIVVPYLVNIKRMSHDKAFSIAKSWLDKCSSIRKLDPGFDYRIKYALKYSQKNGILPIGLEKLRQQNKDLYRMIDIGYRKEI
jgi:hypothetical protein